MIKFTVTENRKHWEKFALTCKNNKSGATYDEYLSELENIFIISQLKKLKPRSMLDIGCGNGQRTALFSNYVKGKTVGIDYSENMIKQAKLIKKHNLYFRHADITEFEEDVFFDAIVSCRCLINQPSYNDQVKLFKKLHKILKPSGHLLIAEASTEGLNNLNKLRKSFGLKKLEEHWFNLHIKEQYVLPKIKHLFKIEKQNHLGLYYYLARVIQPAMSYPKEPKRGTVLDLLAKKSQILFYNSDTTFEKFGRHLLIDFRKIE